VRTETNSYSYFQGNKIVQGIILVWLKKIPFETKKQKKRVRKWNSPELALELERSYGRRATDQAVLDILNMD
jgi:hypothetical protein